MRENENKRLDVEGLVKVRWQKQITHPRKGKEPLFIKQWLYFKCHHGGLWRGRAGALLRHVHSAPAQAHPRHHRSSW